MIMTKQELNRIENANKESDNLSHLYGFRVGESFYETYINTKTDATMVKNEHFDNLFIVDSDAYLYKIDGVEETYVGRFYTDENSAWYFVDADGITETGNQYLIKAEMKIFKKLLEKTDV